ncbi:MFS transporter [Curtobacterium sp. MCBD17_028]|nr:MFS transporter [Curtobacterium sp. MCBD17_028]
MTVIERSYPARAVTARLAVLAAGLFVVGTNAFVIAGLLPEIATSLHTSVSRVSYSITLYAIVVAVASPAISVLLARLDRSRLMAGGLVLIALGTGVAAIAQTIEVFDVGRFLAALGGAALVPAATAAAPAIMPPDQRGRALAIAGLGFTLATAIGSPAGTALAGIGGWRLPLGVLAGLGLVLAVTVAVFVRGVPLGAAIGMRERFRTLGHRPMLATLLATVLLTMAFNVVYIFSAVVTRPATHGSNGVLAVLLLLYGMGGIVGTNLSGRLTDRVGSRPMVAVALAAEAVVLAVLPFVDRSVVAVGAAFVVWGVVAFAAVVPVQHRLVGIDPGTAGIALSWYSTAMYVGIALAPVVGAQVLGVGVDAGAVAVPVAGAVTAVLALVAFMSGYARPRR